MKPVDANISLRPAPDAGPLALFDRPAPPALEQPPAIKFEEHLRSEPPQPKREVSPTQREASPTQREASPTKREASPTKPEAAPTQPMAEKETTSPDDPPELVEDHQDAASAAGPKRPDDEEAEDGEAAAILDETEIDEVAAAAPIAQSGDVAQVAQDSPDETDAPDRPTIKAATSPAPNTPSPQPGSEAPPTPGSRPQAELPAELGAAAEPDSTRQRPSGNAEPLRPRNEAPAAGRNAPTQNAPQTQAKAAAPAATATAEAPSADAPPEGAVRSKPADAASIKPQRIPTGDRVVEPAAVTEGGGEADPGGERDPEASPAPAAARESSEKSSLAAADRVRLVQRVARAVEAARPDGEVRLRLRPPELGSVHLRMKIEDGAMLARIETETSHARALLSEHLPELRERLAEMDIRVERFEVEWRGQSNSQADSSPQRDFRRGEEHASVGSGARGAADSRDHHADAAPRQRIHQGDLDVLV